MLIKWLPRGVKTSYSVIESQMLNNDILASELSNILTINILGGYCLFSGNKTFSTGYIFI